jgi:hypothetical protein
MIVDDEPGRDPYIPLDRVSLPRPPDAMVEPPVPIGNRIAIVMRNHPDWAEARIHAYFREDRNSHDVTLAMIRWMLARRGLRRSPQPE